MKRIKIMGLCLVAVFAISALAAASASATTPEFIKCSKVAPGTGKFAENKCTTETSPANTGEYEEEKIVAETPEAAFTGTIGASTFYIRNETTNAVEVKVVCTNGKDTGEIAPPEVGSPELSFVDFEFEGCTAANEVTSATAACVNINTELIVGLLGSLPGGKVAFLAAGSEPFKYKCGALGTFSAGSGGYGVVGTVSGDAITFAVTANSEQEQEHIEIGGNPAKEIETVWSGGRSGTGLAAVATQTFAPGVLIRPEVLPPPAAPVNTGLPVVSGTAKVGKTLSTSNGTWENSPESYTYKWEDCEAGGGEPCTPIAGATAHEYTLTSNDVGKTVRSVVTAINTGGSSAPADSVASAVVEPAGKTESEDKNEVYGEVPETTTLESGCGSVYLGEFLPGKAESYHNTCALTVTSTGEESTLTAADESATDKGHLVQGSYFLAKALETKATDTEGLGGVSSGSLESLVSPVTLLTYATPVSADNVEVEFNQPIGLHDALHTGKYAKTITLTLKQTKP